MGNRVSSQKRKFSAMKKLISLLTLFSFFFFSISCLTTTYQEPEIEKVHMKPDFLIRGDSTIIGVQTTSGEYVEFSKVHGVEIGQDALKGYKKIKIEINKSQVKKVIREKGKIREVETLDGKRYLLYLEVKGKYFCYYLERVSIPISEISFVWVETVKEVEKIDPGRNFGTFVVIPIAVCTALITVNLLINPPESCPFIYSFDGERYIFDAEPYGGAICRGLKRTEWCGLESIEEINGNYKIIISNELNETQFMDELKLITVDHPRGVKVAPGISGRIHTIYKPIIPDRAYDRKANDILAFISKNDRVFWQTRIEEKNEPGEEDLRDELFYEFPRPAGAKKVKLIVNACNTLWASQVLKRYLDLYGNRVKEWFDEVNNLGPAYFKMMTTHLREELYSLQIRVETEDGWKSKGIIIGGGPLISEEKVCLLDISDVPGDVLKIKLTPPVNFWMINSLAVDYTEDSPVRVTELGALRALDKEGRDIREILAKEDDHYLVMSNIGDRAELVFKSPQHLDNMERSVILKASGYYDIHLEANGEPRLDIVDRFFKEPGYVVHYALKEYLKWKQEIIRSGNTVFSSKH
jgi:hypothetical protein